MAELPVAQLSDWVEQTGRTLTGKARRRDAADVARAFTHAVRDLDRGSVKRLTQRVAHDDDLRDALATLTGSLRDVGSKTPAVTRKVADTAVRDRRVGRLGMLVAAAAVAALVLRALMRRRSAGDPAAVFDAHISSNGAASHVHADDAEVGEPSA